MLPVSTRRSVLRVHGIARYNIRIVARNVQIIAIVKLEIFLVYFNEKIFLFFSKYWIKIQPFEQSCDLSESLTEITWHVSSTP